MAKKRAWLIETDDVNPFDALVPFVIGIAAVVALLVAATFALPFILATAFAWWLYRKWYTSEAQQAARDMAKLRAFHHRVSLLAKDVEIPDVEELMHTVISSVENDLEDGRVVPDFLYRPIHDGTEKVLAMSGLAEVPALDEPALLKSPAARSDMRALLYDLEETFRSGSLSVDELFWYICNVVGHLVERLPKDGLEEPNDYDFTVEVMDVVDDLKGYVELVTWQPFTTKPTPTLKALEDLSLSRMAKASGKTVQYLHEHPEKAPHPSEDKRSAREVAELYLAGWPFLPMLWGRAAYRIPPEARFEHTHIVGGTGHGKTQLLHRFIREDLTEIFFAHRHREAGSDDPPALRSMVVMDSQGDLIKKVSRREFLNPNGVMGGKVLIIDPTDVVHPPALNMFDLDLTSLNHLNPADREMVYNGTIELYVYLFGALLNAELTTRQATMFRYLGQLLLEIPGATFDTLRDVLEDGEKYQPHIDRLDIAAQQFFATQFAGSEFEDVKKQLLWRLWGIRSMRSLADMFNSPKNKIDLFDELQRGTVILINTSKEFLGPEGSKIFGRFWVAMLAQVAIRRAVIPTYARVDTHVYIDEAHEVIDEKAEEILNQARKYRIGLTLAHQNLGQLTSAARATLAASTSIKMLGGVSKADADTYSGDLRTTPERIMSAMKRSGGAEFITFVKNHMPQAQMLNVSFGAFDRMDEMSGGSYEDMRDNIRARYCRSADDGNGNPGFTSSRQRQAPRQPQSEEFDLGQHEEL